MGWSMDFVLGTDTMVVLGPVGFNVSVRSMETGTWSSVLDHEIWYINHNGGTDEDTSIHRQNSKS